MVHTTGAISGSNAITASQVTAPTVGTHYGAISGSNAITATTGTFSGDLTLGETVVTSTLTEYPPVNLTTYTATFNGGVYTASASSESSSSYRAWEAFDGNRSSSSTAWL